MHAPSLAVVQCIYRTPDTKTTCMVYNYLPECKGMQEGMGMPVGMFQQDVIDLAVNVTRLFDLVSVSKCLQSCLLLFDTTPG